MKIVNSLPSIAELLARRVGEDARAKLEEMVFDKHGARISLIELSEPTGAIRVKFDDGESYVTELVRVKHDDGMQMRVWRWNQESLKKE
jgi:hypothetical protein